MDVLVSVRVVNQQSAVGRKSAHDTDDAFPNNIKSLPIKLKLYVAESLSPVGDEAILVMLNQSSRVVYYDLRFRRPPLPHRPTPRQNLGARFTVQISRSIFQNFNLSRLQPNQSPVEVVAEMLYELIAIVSPQPASTHLQNHLSIAQLLTARKQVRPGNLLEVKEYVQASSPRTKPNPAPHAPQCLVSNTLQNRPNRRLHRPQERRRDPRPRQLGRLLPAEAHLGASDEAHPRALLRHAVRLVDSGAQRRAKYAAPRTPNDSVCTC